MELGRRELGDAMHNAGVVRGLFSYLVLSFVSKLPASAGFFDFMQQDSKLLAFVLMSSRSCLVAEPYLRHSTRVLSSQVCCYLMPERKLNQTL